MSDPKTESYVVNISENERLDILGKISTIRIIEKKTEADASKGCLSAIAKIIVAIIDIPTKLVDAFFFDMNVKQGGGSCGFIFGFYLGRIFWILFLTAATYGIVPILYLVCLALGAIDTNKQVFVCDIQLVDGRKLKLKVDESDYKKLSESISNTSSSSVVVNNKVPDKPEEKLFDVIDEFLSEKEVSAQYKILTDKLVVLADCKKSNLLDDVGYRKKLRDLEFDFLSYERRKQLELAKTSGLLDANEYEESKARIEAEDAWNVESQLLLAKAFCNTDDIFEEQVFYWVKKSAKNEHAFAKLWLGELYNFGDGTPENTLAALRCFLDAYELGCAAAANYLSEFYEEGTCVEQDIEMSNWYSRRALELAKADVGRQNISRK